ncbi:MAG: hypothetical protein EA365_00345 [Gloeocapsa sp. DLM2.Bin57]|nr:MAG: hypothetical protein EA365_00345 [Gloeocapsa sp. DLM2.Bin57]
MNYLIAVFANRIKAEEAYTALEKVGFSADQVKIVGKGYLDLEQLPLFNSLQKGKTRAIQMAYWLVPFGFAAGYLFNSLTKIYLFDWTSELGNHLVGGVFGAIAGAMGSIFVGGGVGLSDQNEETTFYNNQLKLGKYLVVIVDTSSPISNQARQILVSCQPDSLTN